jgi:hypothetical protein
MQPGTDLLCLLVATLGDQVEGFAEQAGAFVEARAEQVPDRDQLRHESGRAERVPQLQTHPVRPQQRLLRFTVLIHRRQLGTERGQQRGVPVPREVGRRRAQRSPVQLDRLAVCGHSHRAGRRRHRVHVCVGGTVGALVLVAHEGVGQARRERRLSRAGVQFAAPERGQVRVQRVADQGVPEVVRESVGVWPDEEPLGQLAQSVVDRVRRLAGDRGEQVQVEGAADHRRRAGQRPGRRAQRRGPGQHRLREGVRQRRRRADRGEELLHVQGDAVAAGEDRAGHRGRQRGVGDGGGHGGRVRGAQPGQAGLLGVPLVEQAGTPHPHRHPGIQLVAAVGTHDQHRQPGQPMCEPGQDLQGQVVRPVQVLQRHQHRLRTRPGLGERVGQAGDEQAPLPVTVAGVRLAEELCGVRTESGEGVGDQPAGDVGVRGERGRADHGEAARRGPAGDLGQQAGLADAGLAGEEEQLAAAAGGRREPAVREGQQVVAAHQNGARGAHGVTVGRPHRPS